MPKHLPITIEPFTWSDLHLEQTFRLIDKYIPLKVCRTHEIIPLTFSNRCLTLGIVDLKRGSLHLVINKLLTRNNLIIKGQQIDSKTYQLIISSYLNYQQTTKNAPTPQSEPTPPDIKTILATEKATFVVEDEPQSLPHLVDPFSMAIASNSISSLISEDDKETVIFEGEPTALQHNYLMESITDSPAVMVPNAPVQLHHTPVTHPDYEQLQLHPQHLHIPLENLAHLPAHQLWHELLGRILSEGIGRLYFENHLNEGRILLSESGVMKEGLYGLSLNTFHDVLNEFKRLAHLPPVPVEHPKKVEMEQYYQHERLLLRLRVMPGKYGEEGTLQVLRGQALNFYQQQQMDELGNEAIEAAQKLERKLRHIYLRSQINPSSLKSLNELYGFCDRFRAQLDNIKRRG